MSRSARFLGAWLVVTAALVGFAGAPAAAALGDGQWSPPVTGPVVRGFDPPDQPFGPGHLGVDYAVAPGTTARAAGDGVVVFAGAVGAGLHVVVRHAAEVRTTVSFLATITVVVGEAVRRGALLGTTGGTGPGHGGGVVHFGVRVGGRYVDPMLLFAPPDLTAVVHLAEPRHGAGSTLTFGPSGSAAERAVLAAELRADARTTGATPRWWNDSPVATPIRPDVRPKTVRAVASTGPPPGSSVAVPAAVGAAVLSGAVGSVAARRRRRRGQVDRRGPPTTLQPGPGAPGLRNLARLSGGRGTETTDDTRP